MKSIGLITTLLGITIVCSAADNARAQSLPQESEQIEFATELLAQSQYQYAAFSY